jgi:hypothetical protein
LGMPGKPGKPGPGPMPKPDKSLGKMVDIQESRMGPPAEFAFISQTRMAEFFGLW